VATGFFSERVGPGRALVVGGAVTGASFLTLGLLTTSWPTLLIGMAVGGLGFTITMTAANHLLAQQVPRERQGLAFGVKQAAMPLAGVLAGVALPVLALPLGWRWAFVAAAVALIPVLLAARRIPVSGSPGRRARTGDAPVPILGLLSLGAGLGIAAASSLTTFTVVSAVTSGVAPSHAGLLLMFGSLASISVRVTSGWFADRLGRGSLLLAGGLAGIGAVGYFGLSGASVGLSIAIFTLLAYAGGWGYQGLTLLAVARTNPNAPGAAMGIFRVGPSLGGIIGPLVFGGLVEASGFGSAWLAASLAALASSVILLTTRRALVPYRRGDTLGVAGGSDSVRPEVRT